MIETSPFRQTARLRRYRRPLTAAERKKLTATIEDCQRRLKSEHLGRKLVRDLRLAMVLAVASCLFFWWVWHWIAGCVAGVLSVVIFIASIPEEIRRQKMFRESWEHLLKENAICLETGEIEVIRCQPLAYVKFDEYEDEGVHYVFDVGEDTLLFLGGQNWYPSRRFPNADFEISNNPDVLLVTTGKKIAPQRVIPAEEAQRIIKYHAVIFPFQGHLDTVEKDLQAFYQLPDFTRYFV